MKRPAIFIFLLAAFTAFADVVPWPIAQGRLSGHVHPSLARTKDGTLIVVFQGKGVLMRSRLKPVVPTFARLLAMTRMRESCASRPVRATCSADVGIV
jgi:hypothetical protein